MAKIKYVKHYFGIQPGTVVDEHRDAMVKQLTKNEEFNPATQKNEPIQPIAVLTDEPTTEEIELGRTTKSVKAPPADKSMTNRATVSVK